MMKKVCITLDEEQVEHLQQMSHRLSFERNENVTFSKLIREALEKIYPTPKVKQK